MRSIEVSGKTVEEAKELAAEQLGVPVEDIEFEIIEEPGKGFLGLSHSPAVVRATAAGEPTAEEAESISAGEGAIVSEEPTAMQSGGSADEIAQDIVALLGNIFKAMNVTAQATVSHVDDEEIAIDIEGGEAAAILIGKGGQTLDALQYLMGIAANRKHPHKLRILLDVEGYRKRHDDMLTARALDYARHVKETGEEAVFDPMSARDRRTIHMALKDDPDVYTYSEGEGAGRYLVISPRKDDGGEQAEETVSDQ